MPGSRECGSIMDSHKGLRRGGIFVAVSLPIYSTLWSCWRGMMNLSGMNQNADCAWRLYVTEVPNLCWINTIFMFYSGYGSNGFKGYGGEPIRGKTHASNFYIYQLWGVIYFLLWNNRICFCSWQCWFGSGTSVWKWKNEGTDARCGQVICFDFRPISQVSIKGFNCKYV